MPSDKQIAEDAQRRAEFNQLFNGDLMGDRITHYCMPGCCTGPADTAKKMAKLLIKLVSRLLGADVIIFLLNKAFQIFNVITSSMRSI